MTRRGTEYDYFIESIGHSFSPDGAFHYITRHAFPGGALWAGHCAQSLAPPLGIGILAP